VYTFGSGEKGQLGNGKTGERIITGNKLAFDIVSQPSMSFFVLPPFFQLSFIQLRSTESTTERSFRFQPDNNTVSP
jgi:hypothetical protein